MNLNLRFHRFADQYVCAGPVKEGNFMKALCGGSWVTGSVMTTDRPKVTCPGCLAELANEV